MKKTIMNKVITAGIVTAALASASTVYAEKETYTIGIEQFAEHGSLDNCREGFLEGLADRKSVV